MSEIEYMSPAAPADLERPRYGNADEQRKVRRLIRSLKASGFKVHSLAIEGEGYVRTPTEHAAVCEVFEWDAYVTLRFNRAGAPDKLFGVLLVQGNGEDIVSDYSYDITDGSSLDDPTPGTFSAAMRAFERSEDTREV